MKSCSRRLALKPSLDAGDAEVIVPAEPELAVPDFGAEHAVVVGPNDIDAAGEALVAGDLAA